MSETAAHNAVTDDDLAAVDWALACAQKFANSAARAGHAMPDEASSEAYYTARLELLEHIGGLRIALAVTREDVDMLRGAAGDYETPRGFLPVGVALRAFADRLASLLPPEGA